MWIKTRKPKAYTSAHELKSLVNGITCIRQKSYKKEASSAAFLVKRIKSGLFYSDNEAL